MKRNQILLICLFFLILVIVVLGYYCVDSNKKIKPNIHKEQQIAKQVPCLIVKNQEHSLKISSFGKISSIEEIDIRFDVSGKLEKGEAPLKPGSKFSFNQLLYKVNYEEAFYTLSSRKAQLSDLIIDAISVIEFDFPSERNKWDNFLSEISPSRILPEFPAFSSIKEKTFVISKGILTEYLSIKSLEARMAKYIFLAPFDGKVIEVYSSPGATINSKVKIAKIAKSANLEVKTPIALSQIREVKKIGKASFIDAQGIEIGTGKIIRISESINQETQSVDVFYSIKAINGEQLFSGQFVNIVINLNKIQSCFAIPNNVLNNGKVSILKGTKLEKRTVNIVGNTPDSIFVIGLKNGEKIAL